MQRKRSRRQARPERAISRRQAVAGLAAVLACGPSLLPAQAVAEGLSALARLSGAARLRTEGGGLIVELPLTQPVPWRLRHLAEPPRLALDMRQVDWAGFSTTTSLPEAVAGLRHGALAGGWSRLEIALAQPMLAQGAGMSVDAATGRAVVSLRLAPASDTAFAARVALDAEIGAAPAASQQGARAPLGERPAVVVLDPGHGGIDPGAVHGDLTEAGLMLTFSRELAEALRRREGFEVVTTRDDDSFVSLEARLRIARQAGADLFLSLHADSLPEGEASGATVFTLAAEASDEASALLAERHDRADLLGGGVDLRRADDTLAQVLMAIARNETRPATDRLAQALVEGITGAGLRMHRRPWQQADFTVLRAADIPSVLLEVGFMSSSRDREKLQDGAWRAQMADALADALQSWVGAEAARAWLRRR